MHFLSLSFYIFLLFLKNINGIRFDNYSLFRVVPNTKNELNFFEDISEIYKVNFWRSPGLLRMPVEFSIGPDEKDDLMEYAKEYGINMTMVMDNIQRAFDNQTTKLYFRDGKAKFSWDNYYRLKDIYQWLKDVCGSFPKECKIEYIGQSLKKRKIMAVEIRLKDGPKTRPKVIIEGGIHAREWIAPAFVTYLINEVLYSQRSQDDDWYNISKSYDWFFIPVSNPDGYEYSHTTDRLWRKNLNGVDLNRNFDSKFGTVGVSLKKSSEVYCGEYAFSEPETQALKEYITEHSDDLKFYLSFHSYGQYFILPYAYSKKHEGNYEEVKYLGEDAAYNLRSIYNTKYSVGTAYDTVGYLVSGSSICWVKKTFRVPYVMTIELRDEGDYGFALPPDLIEPTCQETLIGMQTLLRIKTSLKNIAAERYDYGNSENITVHKCIILFNIALFIILGVY